MADQDLIKAAQENIEAYNTGDWPRLKAALVSDCQYDEMSQRRLRGADQMVEAYRGWKQALPDGKGTVTSAIVSGNKVALEVMWTGTQDGAMMGPKGAIPPSGKQISVPGAQVVTLDGDKIKELHQYFDLMTLLQQIGAAPQ